MDNRDRLKQDTGKKIREERFQLLRRFENLFEIPMIILGFIWIVLLILDLLHQSNPLLDKLSLSIWIIFIIDFGVKFFLAPDKLHYIKKNVLTIISLLIPAVRILRVFRLFRLLRLTRGLRLVKVIGSVNRGMRALTATMRRRAFGYVIALTLIVLFTGAAGMHAFEKDVNEGLQSYGDAVWWTCMILTTMGSDFWPISAEGRVLCIILAVYAFAVFGYVTATLATFFIGRDAEDDSTEIAGAKQLDEIKDELRSLKELIKNNRQS